MFRWVFRIFSFVVLTLLTQIGGVAYGLSFFFRRRWLGFALSYALLSVATIWIAPLFGRVPLSCAPTGALQIQSPLYCVLNRHYVTPPLKTVLEDLATHMHDQYPDTVTQVLDTGFPYANGFPLLPHLSHDDGAKADLAFYYRDQNGYVASRTKSPIGYFAFEPGPTSCPARVGDLRWDFAALQPLWPNLSLDKQRMRRALRWLANDPRVGKVLLEPHLKATLGVQSRKIRFQGCNAARHDDHIHLQL